MDVIETPDEFIRMRCEQPITSHRTVEFLRWVAVTRTQDVVSIIRGDGGDVVKIFDAWINLVASYERNPFIRGDIINDLNAMKACMLLGQSNGVRRVFLNLLFGR